MALSRKHMGPSWGLNGGVYELRPARGSMPVLKNPRPQSPVRHLELTSFGWTLGLEQYGPEQDVRTFDVLDPDKALGQLMEYAALVKDRALVYYVTRGRKPKIGAILLGTRVPFGWSPVPVSRPYPE